MFHGIPAYSCILSIHSARTARSAAAARTRFPSLPAVGPDCYGFRNPGGAKTHGYIAAVSAISSGTAIAPAAAAASYAAFPWPISADVCCQLFTCITARASASASSALPSVSSGCAASPYGYGAVNREYPAFQEQAGTVLSRRPPLSVGSILHLSCVPAIPAWRGLYIALVQEAFYPARLPIPGFLQKIRTVPAILSPCDGRCLNINVCHISTSWLTNV